MLDLARKFKTWHAKDRLGTQKVDLANAHIRSNLYTSRIIFGFFLDQIYLKPSG